MSCMDDPFFFLLALSGLLARHRIACTLWCLKNRAYFLLPF